MGSRAAPLIPELLGSSWHCSSAPQGISVSSHWISAQLSSARASTAPPASPPARGPGESPLSKLLCPSCLVGDICFWGCGSAWAGEGTWGGQMPSGRANAHQHRGEGRAICEPPACPRCECAPGYVGSNCSEDFDDCQDHRCQNNAQCLDEVNGYSCLCTEGYRYCRGVPRAARMVMYHCAGRPAPGCHIHPSMNPSQYERGEWGWGCEFLGMEAGKSQYPWGGTPGQGSAARHPAAAAGWRALLGTPKRGGAVRAPWGSEQEVGCFPSPVPSSTLGLAVASSARYHPTQPASLASASEPSARTGPRAWSGAPVLSASACLALVAPSVRSC